jgi:hypothetical protein
MRNVLMISVAATMLSLPALAEDGSAFAYAGHEIDVSYEVSRSRLRAAGYSQVGQASADGLRLKAVDPQGQEVQLAVSPQTGEIVEIEDGRRDP